jgi:pimeloyl-ACP methyl ester carboxylesterase/DNA-binding CsgD family transcriptional regulator
MTSPPVQYVATSDRYRIAYSVRGAGPALLCLPMAFSHAQQVWTDSSVTPLLQAVAERFRVVYYDGRGQGLSQRSLPGTTSIESFLTDLSAVMDSLSDDALVLLADNFWTHVAVTMAAQRPDRIRGLVLMHFAPSYTDQVRWFADLARQNWDYYLDVQVGATRPGVIEARAEQDARKERLKRRTSQADWLQVLEAFASSDVSALLPRLACPVLVLHVPDQQWVSEETAAVAAALIPRSHLVSVPGAGFWGDPLATVEAIEAFFSDTEGERPPVQTATQGLPSLSPRQMQVLDLIAYGKTNREIADELVLSLRTVERHVNDLYARLGVRNRSEAVAIALRRS